MAKTLHIYHTNDVHSHFDNLEKAHRVLAMRRQLHEQDGDDVLMIDLGDFVDRWHPLAEATMGQGMVEVMNQLGIQVATIGNNEGVGLTKENLLNLYNDADFPVLVSNVIDDDTGQVPAFAERYLIKSLNSGLRIGMVAYTAPYPLSYLPLGWSLVDLEERLEEDITFLKNQVDVIFVLSHLGLKTDLEIAENYPEIDLIYGAHTHHVLPEGELSNGVLLTGGGKYGQYIGHTELRYNEKIKKVNYKWTELYNLDDLSEREQDQQTYQNLIDQGRMLLAEEELAYFPTAIRTNWQGTNDVLGLGLDAIVEYTACDLAILNAGLFMTDIHQGIFNRDDLHQLLPHPMRLMIVKMTGRDLTDLIKKMEDLKDFLMTYPQNGMGFRGKVFGYIDYYGISYDPLTEQVMAHNRLLEPKQIYQFVTVDHYLFIHHFPEIRENGQFQILFPKFIREVFGDYAQKHFPKTKR